MGNKFNGFPGGMGNMNNLMKQAQKMQADLQKQSEELANKEFTATVGGGALSITMTGKREVKSVTVSPDLLDPEEKETIEDLISAAVNEVLHTIDNESQNGMAKITGGLGGLF